MIELERHIEILLLDNDCVIVPNFGGFVAHHVEARYDESECSFLPPLRTLGFNPHLKNINDSLLAQSYVEAYDISYPEAQRTISEEVRQLKEILDNEGRYELKDIGTLLMSDDGDMIFEPCEAGILTPELYGLSSFEMKRLAAETTEETEKADNQKAPKLPQPMGIIAAEEEKNPADEEIPATDDNSEDTVEYTDDDTEKIIRIKVSWIRNIAVAAAAIVAFLVLSTPVTNSIEGRMYISDMGTGLLTKISVLDTPNTHKASGNMNDTIRQAVAKRIVAKQDSAIATKPATTAVEDTTRHKPAYCIVLASQVTRSGAENFVKTLKAEGIDNAYTYTNNKVVRVVYGRYDTEQQAHKELRVVRGNKHFEQAWIYKMTH
ncbi:MAG: SPOR domain-containing protein [Prevotellaceae bacterium]|nr:SPOR domain-containing protein [Prevotellaceae bacterium]